MAQCMRCREFYPPGFVIDEKCAFCLKETDTIVYDNGSKRITRQEILKEYAQFVNTVRYRNDILKKALRGDTSEIPAKLILD